MQDIGDLEWPERSPREDAGRSRSSIIEAFDARRRAKAMDRRADLRLDMPKFPSGAPLRTLHRKRGRLRAARNPTSHAQMLDQARPLFSISFVVNRF